MLPTNGLEASVYDVNVTSSSPYTIDISTGLMLIDVCVAYKNESITIIAASGNISTLLTDSPYGLSVSGSGGTLTVSTSTTGSYGLKIRVLRIK